MNPIRQQSSQPEIYYPESNKNSIAETVFHFEQIFYLIETLKAHFHHQNNVYVSGRIKFHDEQKKTRRVFSPDVMIVKSVGNHLRQNYNVWQEKQFPQVIFEISSRRTWGEDLVKKWFLYQQFGVKEYYIFDPEYDCLPEPFIAHRLKRGELKQVSIKNNRIFSEEIGLEIVDTGEGLRLFNPETKQFMRTLSESENEVARLQTELNKLKSQK
ncbi:MAG: Uma2 family endonuclease [Pyrinomonadaceae bacterium]|nr:Uma2 family endonuclease [Pyrinomonadaceae bacterium]